MKASDHSKSPRRKIPSRGWYAVSYFLTIFIFAGIYWALPGEDFYHPNVSREPMLNQDIDGISGELEKEIVATFQNHNNGNQKLIDNWSIDASTFKVLFLKASDKGEDVEVRFKLDMKLTDTSTPHRVLSLAPTIIFSANEGADKGSGGVAGGESNMSRYKPVKVVVPEIPNWHQEENYRFAEILFPTSKARAIQNEGKNSELGAGSLPEVVMPISKGLDKKILSLAKGVQGNPKELSGYPQRMLYLSTVTITALGFGDIMPLSTEARLLVSLEAVIGIILIGLFINAGSSRTSKC